MTKEEFEAAARKYRELNASTVVLCLIFLLYFFLK